MITPNQLDFMYYERMLKGNYNKGNYIMRQLLATPMQAEDFAKNLGAVSVIFGGKATSNDQNALSLYNLLGSSDVADLAAETWLFAHFPGYQTIEDLINDETAMAAVAASSTAMAAVAASSTAMAAVIASSTAMAAVAASSTAMAAVIASSTAMAAVARSPQALNLICKNETASQRFSQSQYVAGQFSTIHSSLGDTQYFTRADNNISLSTPSYQSWYYANGTTVSSGNSTALPQDDSFVLVTYARAISTANVGLIQSISGVYPVGYNASAMPPSNMTSVANTNVNFVILRGLMYRNAYLSGVYIYKAL